jgi:hypothetical protein
MNHCKKDENRLVVVTGTFKTYYPGKQYHRVNKVLNEAKQHLMQTPDFNEGITVFSRGIYHARSKNPE